MAHSSQTRPWDRHLLLYYPGTDGSFQPNQALGRQTFAPLLPWGRHLLLYYPETDGSVQPKQTLHRLAPLGQTVYGQTVYGLTPLGQKFHRLVPPWDKQSMGFFPLVQSQTDSLDSLLVFVCKSDSKGAYL